ncbi:hypothetical protein [White spot syndrome virus]|uniref:Uncharacterized protein n=1 Tax=White spot syndrome virus TaxID=342409 RepID=A0A2R2XF01_9VIRU|nr:hypothetical protein [White spot syndrome virus]
MVQRTKKMRNSRQFVLSICLCWTSVNVRPKITTLNSESTLSACNIFTALKVP